MKLTIKRPHYYADHYKVDEEIEEMCLGLSAHTENREYSAMVKIFDIIPVIAPQAYLATKSDLKSLNMFTKSIGRVSVFVEINYDNYKSGTTEIRKKMIIRSILDASAIVKNKFGAKFDDMQFRGDILSLVGYTEDEIAAI